MTCEHYSILSLFEVFHAGGERHERGTVAGRIDIETIRTALGEYVFLNAYERVLFPERIFVALGIIAAFVEELLVDEQIGVLPHLYSRIDDEADFPSLRIVPFVAI